MPHPNNLPNDFPGVRTVHLNCPDTLQVETFRDSLALRFFGESGETVVIVQAVPRSFPVEILEHDYPAEREPASKDLMVIDAYCDQVCASIRDHQDWYMEYMHRLNRDINKDSLEASLIRQAVCLAIQVAMRPQCFLPDETNQE